MINDLRRFIPAMPQDSGAVPDGHDWRIIRQEGAVRVLRRAFMVPDKTAVMRYAVPVALAAVIMIMLGNILLGLGYAAFCTVKWLCTDIHLKTVEEPEYSVQLGRTKIFGEPL